VSLEFREFAESMGIKFFNSSPYYAQANGQAEVKMATGMTPADTGFLCPRPPPRSHARARALHPPRAGHHARTRYPRAFRARGHTRAHQTEPRRGPRSRTRRRARDAAPTRLRPCVGEQGVPPRLSRGAAASREQGRRVSGAAEQGTGGRPARSRGGRRRVLRWGGREPGRGCWRAADRDSSRRFGRSRAGAAAG
jgi:hypothetical protein